MIIKDMKMNRLVLILLFITVCVTTRMYAQTRMTDQQVIEYVKQATQEGKEQKQIAAELARRGVTREQAERVKKLYEQQMGADAANMQGTELNEARLREETQDETTALTDNQPTTEELAQEDQVFGRNIFNTRNLTFEPNSNMATPPNYQLGPGDEVIIDIWGASQTSIRQHITPDGTLNMQELGPIDLSGMTV